MPEPDGFVQIIKDLREAKASRYEKPIKECMNWIADRIEAALASHDQAQFDKGWQLAHELAKCGHPRACYQDSNWPKSEGDEKCIVCEALAAHDQKVRAEVLTPIIAYYANFYDNAIFTRKDILDFLASETEAKSYFEALLRNARKDALEEAAILVDKAFEQSWVVQDTLDAIRSLAGAEEKKTK